VQPLLVTKGQAAILELTRAVRDMTGNLGPMPGVFPDYLAPIVRNAPDGVRELMLTRLGSRDRRSSAARPSQTSAIQKARIGARGSNPKTVASCRSIPFREYVDTFASRDIGEGALAQDGRALGRDYY
jgi:hypothetical protein